MFLEEVMQLNETMTETNKMSAEERAGWLSRKAKTGNPGLQNPYKFPESNPVLFGNRRSSKFKMSPLVPQIENQDLDDRDSDGESGEIKSSHTFMKNEQLDLSVATEASLTVSRLKAKSLSDVLAVCDGRLRKEPAEWEERKE